MNIQSGEVVLSAEDVLMGLRRQIKRTRSAKRWALILSTSIFMMGILLLIGVGIAELTQKYSFEKFLGGAILSIGVMIAGIGEGLFLYLWWIYLTKK